MHDNINLEDEIQEGFIVQLDGDLAKVRVAPNADCDNCGACNIVHMEILAYNPVKATPGQKVKFTMIQDNMLKISFMIFIFPLLSLFTGLYSGSLVSSIYKINNTGAMTTGGLLMFCLAIVIIFFYDKKYKLNKSNFPQIIEVIK
ncbi:MAG TPA: SoxR reducing system RseC family protein [Spirochaetota bacterium]|nr:SoxR reducing system RseC family protein [Spirochaetota bacterium]HPS87640.1 SoxR reducing system RseC family protein [Spirochaetota bacterium]